jgi:hypothetical protein
LPPFAAAIASAVLLILLSAYEDLRWRTLALLIGWFLLAVYCQFLSDSNVIGTTGLVLQTLLAIYLLLHLKLRR